jgi:anti-sigma regulatory factor (Ser/Thr protein kinase)
MTGPGPILDTVQGHAGVPTGDFHHEALLYADEDELLAGAIPFLRAGMEGEEALLVAMPSSSLRLLEGELRGADERVQFVDMQQLGRNPARIISAWHDFVVRNLDDGRPVRGIGEPIWAGRSAAELDECDRHEALLNLAFADSPAWSLLCPYNISTLDEAVLEGAERNHPVIRERGDQRDSARHTHPSACAKPFDGRLAPPQRVLAELSFGIADLARVRRLVGELAAHAGLISQQVQDLVLAADEAATNSVRHGGGCGRLRVWRDDRAVGCDIHDRGHIEEPLVGRIRPPGDQLSGRGLWLANHLCDLVQIRSCPAGSVVRLQISL